MVNGGLLTNDGVLTPGGLSLVQTTLVQGADDTGIPVGFGLAVKKQNDDLAQALQAAINTLAENGELGKFFAALKVSWRKP